MFQLAELLPVQHLVAVLLHHLHHRILVACGKRVLDRLVHHAVLGEPRARPCSAAISLALTAPFELAAQQLLE